MTDWQDIEKLVFYHKVAPTMKEAVKMAVLAGIDMSMIPSDYSFPTLLKELVKEGSIPESRIDESVTRILNLKSDLGILENPLPDPNNPLIQTIGSQPDRSQSTNAGKFRPLKAHIHFSFPKGAYFFF